MRLSLTILVLAALAGPAQADDDCFVAMTDWQPRVKVTDLAKAQGWAVRRLRIDDGCYEIDGWDRDGRRIEVKVHPADLTILEWEFEDDDHGHDDDHGEDGDRRPGRDWREDGED